MPLSFITSLTLCIYTLSYYYLNLGTGLIDLFRVSVGSHMISAIARGPGVRCRPEPGDSSCPGIAFVPRGVRDAAGSSSLASVLQSRSLGAWHGEPTGGGRAPFSRPCAAGAPGAARPGAAAPSREPGAPRLARPPAELMRRFMEEDVTRESFVPSAGV